MVVRDVPGLLFHPDLIFGTPLASKISSFGFFFNYSQEEALLFMESTQIQKNT